jgi:hypothetical protein
MIVATLIMGIAIVGMLSGLAGATRNAARLMEHDRAVQLARIKMNDLIADRDLPREQIVNGPFAPQETGGVDAGWRARVSVFERSKDQTAFVIDRIELEIWWMAGNEKRTYPLEGYRMRPTVREDLVPEAAQP